MRKLRIDARVLYLDTIVRISSLRQTIIKQCRYISVVSVAGSQMDMYRLDKSEDSRSRRWYSELAPTGCTGKRRPMLMFRLDRIRTSTHC